MRRAPFLSVLLPIAAVLEWAHLREPLHAWGFGLFLFPALLLAVMMPAFFISLAAVPALLIPNRWRIRWRHRHEGRPHIPVRLRRAVYAADRYCCAYCRSPEKLQLDHVRPWASGGLTSFWNMVTLCGRCNRIKSNYWVDRDGYVHYRGFDGSEHAAVAAQILDFELGYRWRPGRWIRAGWMLAA